MNPLETRVQKLEQFMKDMQDFARLPYTAERAMARRLRLDNVPNVSNSSVNVSTFTQAVSEAGSNTYDVAKPMTGFISIILDNGTIHTVATYD